MEWADKTIYVGPMGCRTGMYVILKGLKLRRCY